MALSMTVTAKLFRRLHEMLGDDAAHDMVDWMQRVDAERTDLRQLHELQFARFDARLGEFRAKMQAGLADLRRDMETGIARLETGIEQRTADIMKWSFVFWVGLVATLGAVGALVRFLP